MPSNTSTTPPRQCAAFDRGPMNEFVYNPWTQVVHRDGCTQGPMRANSDMLAYPPFPAEMVSALRADRWCSFCRPQAIKVAS